MASIDLTGLSQDEAINKAADYAGLDPSVLKGMEKTESGGNPDAVSPAGAAGAFQIMPATQKTWEEREGRSFNAHDWHDSLTLAALQMKENLSATGGKVDDALRMYNAGPDRSRWNNPETSAYAGKVLGTGVAPEDTYETSAAVILGHQELDPEQVWNTAAHDLTSILRDQTHPEHTPILGKAAKGLIDAAGVDAASAAVVTGLDPGEAALSARQAVAGNIPAALQDEVAQGAAAPVNASSDTDAFQELQERAKAAELDETKARAVTVQEKLGSFMDSLPTAAILDHFSQHTAPDQYFPDEKYMANYVQNFDKIEAGYTDDEVDQLRSTINDKTYQQTLANIHRQRVDRDHEMADTTPLSRLGYNLAGGLLDPASMAITLGVGKVATVVGMGAREAFMERNIVGGLLKAGTEGAVSNMALTATTQAMGRHVSSHDYAAAAGFGMLLGAGGSLLHLRGDIRAGMMADVQRQAGSMVEEAAKRNNKLYTDALAMAGADPKPADIEAAATKVDLDTVSRTVDDAMNIEPNDVDHLLPPRPRDGEKVDRPLPEPQAPTVLPKELAGAKPSYNFGSKKFDLQFANDVDKAGYIIAQKNPSKRDAEYLAFVKAALGTEDDAVARNFGVAVRAAIKNQAESAEPGTLQVEQAFHPQDNKPEVFAEMDESPEPSATVAGDVEDRVRETLLGGTTDAERLFPRPDVDADPFELGNNARLNTPRKLKEVIDRYGLESQIADTSEKKIIAESLARAEEIVAANPINDKWLKPLLAKVGWEAASTRQLASGSVVLRAFAIKALENPEGAAGRGTTAAMVKYMRESAYMGNFLRNYENAYKLYAARMGRGHIREAYDPIAARDFDAKVYEELDRRLNNKTRTDDPLVKLGADIVDIFHNQPRKDMKYVGAVGAARLPDVEHFEGYITRRFAAGKIQSFTRAEREAAVSAWSSEFQATAGWDKKFSDKFAVEYLDRARERALGGYSVPANLHSPEVADMVRDSLAALSIPPDEVAKIMGRFSRGGASFTKGRIEADLTREFPDGNGGSMKLMDMLDTNITSLVRSYARRASGEVALARLGILGTQGAKIVRAAAKASGATADELESFDQTIAEFFGTPFGGVQSLVADNARALTSALTMGGMGFTQLGDYGNAIGHIGVLRTMNAIGSIPRLLGEVWQMRKGVDVNNHWLGSMEGAYGPSFGMEGYNMRTMWDVNDRYDMAGKEAIGIGSKAIRASSHLNHIMSGHRAIVAVQIRGMAEQIVQKALKYMREGGEDLALDGMGITRDIRDRLGKDLDKIAVYQRGHVVGFDISKATDLPAAEAFMQAVHRGAAQIVQDTFIGETGKWAHSSFLKLLTQFRQFGLTSTQKQWRRQAFGFGTAKALMYLLGAASFAIPIHIARVQLKSLGKKNRKKYLAQQLSPLVMGRQVMNYAAALGILPDVMDIAGGAFQLSPYGSGPNTPQLLKAIAPQGGRYGGTSGLVGSIIPAVGTIDNAWHAVQTRKLHDAVQLLPGSKNPFLQYVINQLDTK